MQYQVFRVNMPDPRAPSGSGDMVGGRFHVVSKHDPPMSKLVKLAGPGVQIVSIDQPPRPWTQADIEKMGPVSKRKMRNKGIVTELIPDGDGRQPFQE